MDVIVGSSSWWQKPNMTTDSSCLIKLSEKSYNMDSMLHQKHKWRPVMREKRESGSGEFKVLRCVGALGQRVKPCCFSFHSAPSDAALLSMWGGWGRERGLC